MQDGLRFQINSQLLGLRYKEGMSFNRDAHSCLKVARDSEQSLSQEKNWDTFLMRICSWNEKCVFGLCFHFQDSRFILSVRKIQEKMRNYQAPLPFLLCSPRQQAHPRFFFKRLKPILQIYMLLEMEETLGNIKHFSKGNFLYAFGVGQYLCSERSSVLKIPNIYGLWYKMLKASLVVILTKASLRISKHPLGGALAWELPPAPWFYHWGNRDPVGLWTWLSDPHLK